MPLTPPQYRTLQTVLRYGSEQIEEAENIVSCISPRTANEVGQLARTQANPAWPGVIACGDLTLLGGAPGMGKSQVAIYAAATVSRGGTWPDGSRAQRGSTFFARRKTGPEWRCAHGLKQPRDLARVQFGKHMDLSAGHGRACRCRPSGCRICACSCSRPC